MIPTCFTGGNSRSRRLSVRCAQLGEVLPRPGKAEGPPDEPDLTTALNGTDAVILAVRHKHYLNLDPDEVVKDAGGPIAVIDCFGILDDEDQKVF